MPGITAATATPADLPDLVRFFRTVAAEEFPGDPDAADEAEAGLRRSLGVFDLWHTGSCRLLLARVGKGITGYAVAVRIPKLDARMGFLFVDELYVLPSYRRRGVARRLISHVQLLAREEGLAGVRLLVRPENGPARALYRGCAFEEQESVFCQWCSAPAGPLGRAAARGESAC